MAEQFLTKEYLESLQWNCAGALSSANSPFGMIVKNSHGEFWIVSSGTLCEIIHYPEHGQMLCRNANGDDIGFLPLRVKTPLKDRFLSAIESLRKTLK